MGRFNFTKRAIDALPIPAKGWQYHYDLKTRGLAIGVGPTGAKTFYLYRKIGGRPERIRLGQYPDLTIEKANAKATKYNAAIADGKNPADVRRTLRSELTLRQLFDLYLVEYALPRRKKTVPAMRDNFVRYLGDLGQPEKKPRGRERVKPKGSVNWEDRKLSQIGRPEIRRLHNALGANSGPYAANRALELLRALFNFANRTGNWSGENPAAGVEEFTEASRDRFIQSDELPAFFRALADESNETLRNFFLLSILTGARRANVLATRWDQVHLDRAEWRIPETKNSTPQTVTLVPEAVIALESQRTLIEAEAKKARALPSPWVFPGTGATGHLASPKKAWARVLERAGIKDLRIHDLRRSLGSWQARTGASLTIIGKSLHHKSHQSTAVYARLDLDPVRESMERATSAILVAAGVKPAAPVSTIPKRHGQRGNTLSK